MKYKKLDGLYFDKGEDVTWFVVNMSSSVAQIIAKREKIPFPRAATKLVTSRIFKLILNTETGLCYEEPEYVADLYYEEQQKQLNK